MLPPRFALSVVTLFTYRFFTHRFLSSLHTPEVLKSTYLPPSLNPLPFNNDDSAKKRTVSFLRPLTVCDVSVTKQNRKGVRTPAKIYLAPTIPKMFGNCTLLTCGLGMVVGRRIKGSESR